MVFIDAKVRPFAGRLLRWLMHADPELLEWLNREYDLVTDQDSLDRITREFSFVLNDLFICGAWKRTLPGRLEFSEYVLGSLLKNKYYKKEDAVGEIQWLDLGASDGITTVEMLRHLRSSLHGNAVIKTIIADQCVRLDRYSYGPLIEYRSPDHGPVLTRIGALGLRLPYSPRRYDPISTLLAKLYMKFNKLRIKLCYAGSISLINPIIRSEEGIAVITHNVFRHEMSFVDRFEIIRVSNVLNRRSYTDNQLLYAITNLFSYLRDNGFFLVSRNVFTGSTERESGSVWRRSGNEFVWVTDYSGGSEIKLLLDQWNKLNSQIDHENRE